MTELFPALTPAELVKLKDKQIKEMSLDIQIRQRNGHKDRYVYDLPRDYRAPSAEQAN